MNRSRGSELKRSRTPSGETRVPGWVAPEDDWFEAERRMREMDERADTNGA